MFGSKDFITIGIACIALLVSFTTLYLAHFKAARVLIMAGDNLNIGHFIEGNLNISLPVSFVNHGARTAIVRRVALLVQIPNNNEGYLLEPLFFQRVDEKGNFLQDSPSAPIGIGSKQSLTKQILFRSSHERPTEFQLLDSGTYNFTLLGWVKDVVHPDISDSFSIIISEETASNLRASFESKSGPTIRVPQAIWRNSTARSLTAYQVKGLIS